MAASWNGHGISRGIGLAAVLGLLAVWQFLITPTREAVDRLERDLQRLRTDMNDRDDKLWKALDEHIHTEGHPGAMATISKLDKAVTAVDKDATMQFAGSLREHDRLWSEMQAIQHRLEVFEQRSCDNGRKGG